MRISYWSSDVCSSDLEAGKVRGPLHGIPMLLKDHIDATPMVNSAGSLALAEHRPEDDAFLVQRLREAGAVILGKTHPSEWANIRSSHSPPRRRARGRQTLNPYRLVRSPSVPTAGPGHRLPPHLSSLAIGPQH